MAQSVPFEILVATMFRSDFRFLEAMFPNGVFQDHHILVINQTDPEHTLLSDHKHIRVINTEERGLSRSRNMAIDHAIGAICLIADDDVRYVSDVEEIIVSAFAKAKKGHHKSPTIITFQMTDSDGALYKTYPKIKEHSVASLQGVSSVEIAFDRAKVVASKVRFHTNFGLGATFQTAEEYIFLREVLAQGGTCLLQNEVILSHPQVSSGQFSGNDAIIYGRAALRYKYMGRLAYLSMVKYAWFYCRRGEIKFTEIPSKIAIAFAGIHKYKNLFPSRPPLRGGVNTPHLTSPEGRDK